MTASTGWDGIVGSSMADLCSRQTRFRSVNVEPIGGRGLLNAQSPRAFLMARRRLVEIQARKP